MSVYLMFLEFNLMLIGSNEKEKETNIDVYLIRYCIVNTFRVEFKKIVVFMDE